MQRRGFLTSLFAAALAAPLAARLMFGQEKPPKPGAPRPGEPRPGEPKPKDPKPDEPKPRPDQKTTLAGARGHEKAKGEARYRDRPDERELDVEVEKLTLPYGTPLTVLVNGVKVGEVEVGLLHSAKLKLRSKKKDVIPFITIGTTVTVRTKDDVIATGKF